MVESTADNKRPGGRPRTGIGTLIGVRLQPGQLAMLDAWIAQQETQPSRPEAIRLILREKLA